MTTELTCSPSLDQSSALITRCHPMKHARCGLICANADGMARRRKRSSGIRCRIENCVQSFTAVNYHRLPPDRHIDLCWCTASFGPRGIITEMVLLTEATLLVGAFTHGS